MIKIPKNASIGYTDTNGCVRIQSKAIRKCYACKQTENIIGCVTSISSSGEIYLWFWCADHEDGFKRETEAVAVLGPTQGHASRYIQ